MTTPTTPAPYSQGDGSPYQWSNCLFACETMGMHRGTVGLWRVPASRLRTISGDTYGGVTLDQAAAAAETATKGQYQSYVRYDITRAMLKAFVVGGHAAKVVILCSYTVKTRRRTNSFTGRHGIYINAYRWSSGGTNCRCELRESGAASHKYAHGEFYIKDPGVTSIGFRWWSAQLVYRAAEMGKPAGSGVIDVSLTRDTEGVTRVARIRAPIKASASKTAKTVGYTKAGVGYVVPSTTNGTTWERDTDGGQSDNWHRIKYGGYTRAVRGEALR